MSWHRADSLAAFVSPAAVLPTTQAEDWGTICDRTATERRKGRVTPANQDRPPVGLAMINTPQLIALTDYDPADTHGLAQAEATERLAQLEVRLAELQDALYGAAQHAVLVILQGMDTSGKDGTIKHVMSIVNPTGCQVWSFKPPTPEELAHDFLWRVHHRTPAKGVLGVFNRSHYEDVLVARVHELVPSDTWASRYEQINAFERMLTQNGTILLKFFLHLSKAEQKQRLLAREQKPKDGWKLSVGDWEERAYWDAYQQAYEAALGQCGTPWAPWFIVPSDKKWYRNYIVAKTLVERLTPYHEHWRRELDARGAAALKAIHAARAHKRLQ
jgi:PPK2 family polyphosphate:nucleotide phosphotransferase